MKSKTLKSKSVKSKSRTKKSAVAKPVAKKLTPAKKSAAKIKLPPKVLKLEQLDKLLLNLAPYKKVKKQVAKGTQLLNQEREFAVKLGTQIIRNAENVREQLVKHYRTKRK
jgi:hypothetical protein